MLRRNFSTINSPQPMPRVNRLPLLVALFSLAIGLSIQSSAQAQSFILEFGRGNVVASDGSTFNTMANAGESVAFQVYLTQIAPESRLNDASTGLAIADVTIDVTAGGTMLTPVSFTFGPGLTDDLTGNTGINGQMVRLAAVEPNALGQTGAVTGDSPGANSVLLGTINYNIGAGVADGTTFTLNAASSGGLSPFAVADAVFPVAIPVNPGIANLVIGIPEPSTFALLGLGSVYCGYRYRRRSRSKKSEV